MAQRSTQYICNFASSELAAGLELATYSDQNVKLPLLSTQQAAIVEQLLPGIFKQICKVFPTENDVDRLIAIAASLSFACRYDDQLELLGFAEKEVLISRTLELFDGASFIEDLEIAEPIQKALKLTYDIMNTLKFLLPQHHQTILSLLREPVVAFRQEASFQQSSQDDLDLYQQIRHITIGVKPLIRVLSVGRLIDDQRQSSKVNESMLALENTVTDMCGLQNDLFGLQRDLEAGDFMSYPVVRARSMRCHNLDESVLAGLQEHNSLGRQALIHYQHIKSAGSEAEQYYAHQLFYVPTLSFKFWARESRYQPKAVPVNIITTEIRTASQTLSTTHQLSQAVAA